MTAVQWMLTALGTLLIGWATALGVGRVRRLDRLHVRMDAARAGLSAALERRVAAALAATRADGFGPDGASNEDGGAGVTAAGPVAAAGPVWVSALAARATGPEWSDREAAENRLGRALAGLDRTALPAALRTELVEAEIGLVLARHVHNDAVRDTLGLRSRRLVRWLRLAGTAPLPRYFEIADPWIGPDNWASTGPG